MAVPSVNFLGFSLTSVAMVPRDLLKIVRRRGNAPRNAGWAFYLDQAWEIQSIPEACICSQSPSEMYPNLVLRSSSSSCLFHESINFLRVRRHHWEASRIRGPTSSPSTYPLHLSQFNSVVQSCPALCDPMDYSMPGLCPSPTPGAYSDSCPLSRWCHPTISSSVVPSSSSFNLSQHQGLFKWVSSLHQEAKVLEFQLQHQSFQWIFRTDFL